MASPTLLVAAVAVFIVAALLFYQSQQQGLTEGFAGPIAGRPYSDRSSYDHVPADLTKAPRTTSTAPVPASMTRPATVPGPAMAPRDLPATQKDLQELEVRLNTWLSAADQLENEHPGWLTPDQRHQRVIYAGRVASIYDQLGTGMITDTASTVAAELADLRRQNQTWKKQFPNLDELSGFGLGRPADVFLDADEVSQFRALLDATIQNFKTHPQPDPLERVRTQQLQMIQQDLIAADRASGGRTPPPIRMGSARLFLTQMMKPDQPLPTLFAMEANPATEPPAHAESTADIIAALKDVDWTLTISHDPASQELKRAVAAMLTDIQERGATMTPQQVAAARSQVAAIRTARAPAAMAPTMAGLPPAMPGAPWPAVGVVKARAHTPHLTEYDPDDLMTRARTLCKEVREAFGTADAAALGCPKQPPATRTDAETVLNVVCDRIRTSVPSVDPAQFNCPRAVRDF